MRILFIIDDSIKNKKYEAYKRSRDAIDDLLGIEYDEKRKDLSEAVWWSYGDSKYLSERWISRNSEWEMYEYDCVCYCIDEDNWAENSGIHGVAFGSPFRTAFVQQVKIRENETHTKNTMLMEVTHAIDNIVFDALGIDLDKELGLDFDEDLIHAEKKGERLFRYEDDVELVRDYLDRALELRNQHWTVYNTLKTFNLISHFPTYLRKRRDKIDKQS